MENVSFAHRLDHAPTTWFDDTVERDHRRSRSDNPAPAYRAAGVLDSLIARAAVYDCAAGCATTNA